MEDRLVKVRAEIERLYNQSLADEKRQAGRGLERAASVSYGKSKACKELLSFIDTLQKEQVSEDLERISNKYCINAESSYTNDMFDRGDIYKAFKAGANWQEQQMIKTAIIGLVHPDDAEVWVSKRDLANYHEDEKVNLIIRKIE